MSGWKQKAEGTLWRLRPWRVYGVLLVVGGYVIWLPFREGHGLGLPQVAMLASFALLWPLLLAFVLDLVLVQLLQVGRRRDAAVCIFEILFLLLVLLAVVLHEARF